MDERRYPLCVATLADIVRAARGEKSQVTFAAEVGIDVPVLRRFEKGRKVRPESVEALVRALPEQAAAIATAIAVAANTAHPVVYKHTDERGAVRPGRPPRLPQQEPVIEEGDALPFPHDPVKSAIVRIYDGLSDRARLDALTAMGEIAQRDRLRSVAPKVKG